MEISANYTISSYDKMFPHFDIVDSVIERYANRTFITEVNLMYMLLNLNYVRYVNQTNRYFRIYFENLPKYKDYLPFWNLQEKQMLKKIINDPTIGETLFSHNTTVFDMMLEDIKRELKKVDRNIVGLMLTDSKVEEAINVINSRCFILSLKGWKVLHNKIDEVDEEGIIYV